MGHFTEDESWLSSRSCLPVTTTVAVVPQARCSLAGCRDEYEPEHVAQTHPFKVRVDGRHPFVVTRVLALVTPAATLSTVPFSTLLCQAA